MIEWRFLQAKKQSNKETLVTYRNCPVCDNNNTNTLLSFENFQFFCDIETVNQADIVQRQCRKCGALYMNPCYSSEGFAILFELAGMSYGQTPQRAQEEVDWLVNRNLLRDNCRVLDIGCGTGKFLSLLPHEVKKTGVDIDKKSIENGRSKYPQIEFICSDFNSLRYEREIDIITMFHVLEHLPTPLETLKNLAQISDKKTHLVIEVPIIENGLTNDINGFFSVQHLTHFSRLSLKNILKKSGWKILEWAEQKDYNGCRVLAKKTKTQEDISYSNEELKNIYNYFPHWYKSLFNVENIIQKIGSKKCIIWGGGMHLEFLYQTTSLFNKKIQFIIVDSDISKQNKKWRGINIYSPEKIKTIDKNILLVISSYGNQENIYNACVKFGKEDNTIIKLYDYIRRY